MAGRSPVTDDGALLLDRSRHDLRAIWSDTTRSREALGWKAERDLLAMMGTAWAWERQRSEEK